jgi:hypothetical protein
MNVEDYAIVVGINAYPRLRPLKGALKDATKFAEWLKNPSGGALPERNVELVISPEEPQLNLRKAAPIQEDIDAALTRFGVERGKRIGRRLYFYFAGHGIGTAFNEVGMLMAHAAMTALKRNIGLARYRDYLHEHALFDQIVFIIDCCRDRTGGVETAGPDFTNTGDGPAGAVDDFTIMAAAYGERAFEPPPVDGGEPRGLLTAAVLEGLGDSALADGSGRFTSGSLERYIKRRVPEMAGDVKVRQQPEVYPPQAEIVFGSAPVETVPVRIVASSRLTGDLVLRDDQMVEIARRPAAGVTRNEPPWVETLSKNRWYAVQRTADPPGSPPDLLVLDTLKGPDYVFEVKRHR